MSTKVKGIVIGGTNIKEKDKLVSIFTLEKGKIVASMKGVRGDKAKLKFAKEPFCFGEFIIEEGKFNNIITSVDIIDNFYDLTKDIEKYYEGCAILDIINKVIVEPNAAVFIELIKALKSLCYDNLKKYYVLDKFLIFLFKEMGYAFVTDKCASCGATLGNKYFNLEVGEIVCSACKNDAMCVSISNPCYSAIKILLNTDYEKLATIKLGGAGEVQAYNLLNKNFEWRTGYKLLSF